MYQLFTFAEVLIFWRGLSIECSCQAIRHIQGYNHAAKEINYTDMFLMCITSQFEEPTREE